MEGESVREDSSLLVFKGLRMMGDTNGSPHSQGPQSPSIPLLAPTIPPIRPGRASQLWDLGKPRRKAVTLAHSGCIILLRIPSILPPLENSSRKFWPESQGSSLSGPWKRAWSFLFHCSPRATFHFLSNAP